MVTIKQAQVEYTDTFAGEANYCWVRRAQVPYTEVSSDLAIVRKAKAAVGLTGVRCRRENWGDTIVLRPVGACTVCFISFND